MTPAPNNKYNEAEEGYNIMARPPNEESSLLLAEGTNDTYYDAEAEEASDEYAEDDAFPTLEERRDSFQVMKQVVHNNQSVEDMQQLLGSTSFLKNALDQEEETSSFSHKPFKATRHRQRRSNSFTLILPSTMDAEDKDVSTLSFRPQKSLRRSHHSFNGVGELEKSYHNEGDTNFMLFSQMSKLYKQRVSTPSTLYLKKIKTSFFDDAKSLAEGTIPQSIVLATVIGIVCGIACYLYYSVLFFGIEFFWTTLPKEYVVPSEHWSPEYYWLWIPLVCSIMVTFVGLTVVYMGEPGDLAYTISRVHCEAYIPMNHVIPMVFASIFSILAGGSLGPEAPLVAICGALGGFVSRRFFRQHSTNVVRKHTLMGMAGALAAFFGVPLGGSLFALEVCSRFGVEYFEHLIESIFCGEICLMVFRGLSGLPIAPIWNLTSLANPRLVECKPNEVFMGAFIGLYGALLAYFFASFHWMNMEIFGRLNLLDNSRAVYRGLLSAIFIVLLALLIPHSAFWGEEEIQIVATMSPAKELPHIWPTTGLTGFEMDTPFKVFLVGCSKLVAVSFTVAGGLRGGYIFPLMCAGCAFGRLLYFISGETIPLQIVVLCTAAGLNVAITRTTLATTLILAFLPGEPIAIPPLLMASICSLFATSYMPFIKSQITRSDIDHSLFHEEHHVDVDSVFSDATSNDDYFSD